MCKAESSLVSLMNSLFKTIFQVRLTTHSTNEWHFQDHFLSRTPLTWSSVPWDTWTINVQSWSLPQCHWWTASSRPSFVLNQRSALLDNECAKPNLPSVANEWHFQVHHLSKLPAGRFCLWGDLNNDHAEASPVSLTNCLFKTIFCVELHWPEAVSLMRPEKWTCRVFQSITDGGPFQNHLASGTLLTWALSLGWWTLSSPSVLDQQPFQDHLLINSMVSVQKVVCWET